MKQSFNKDNKIVKSLFYLFSKKIVSNILRLITVSIVARQLTSDEFGIIALANILFNFLIFSQTNGIKQYIIHLKKDFMFERYNLAFWYNLLITIVQGIVVLFLVHNFSYFRDQIDSVNIIYIIYLTYFIKQLYIIPESITEKEIEYDFILKRDIISDIFTSIFSILMALNGYSYWSLIIPYLFIEPFKMFYTYYQSDWIPRLSVDFKNYKYLIRYTFNIMGSSILNLFINDFDKVIVGKFLGNSILGFYSLAWQLSNFINRNITVIISRISLPFLSKDNADLKKLANNYKSIIEALCIFTLPIYSIFFFFSKEMILLIYGNNWIAMDSILKIFLIYTAIRAVTSPTGVIYNVLGKPYIGFRIQLFLLPIYIISLYLSIFHGLKIFLLTIVIFKIVSAIITYVISLKVLEVNILNFSKKIILCILVNIFLMVVGSIFNNIIILNGLIVFTFKISITTLLLIIYYKTLIKRSIIEYKIFQV